MGQNGFPDPDLTRPVFSQGDPGPEGPRGLAGEIGSKGAQVGSADAREEGYTQDRKYVKGGSWRNLGPVPLLTFSQTQPRQDQGRVVGPGQLDPP